MSIEEPEILKSHHPNLKFDRMRENDLSQVVSLELESGLNTRGIERYRRALENQQEVLLVAVIDGLEGLNREVIGFFSANIVLDELQIDNISIAGNWRGRGLGTTLLMAGLREAYRKGARFATLEVRSANTKARSLYERHGFVIDGKRSAYYRDPTDDALMMSCNLSQSKPTKI